MTMVSLCQTCTAPRRRLSTPRRPGPHRHTTTAPRPAPPHRCTAPPLHRPAAATAKGVGWAGRARTAAVLAEAVAEGVEEAGAVPGLKAPRARQTRARHGGA